MTILRRMQSRDGRPQFCDGCPAAKAVEGPIDHAICREQRYAVETMGMAYLETEREIRLVGDNGGLSMPIAGRPDEYTTKRDMQRVMENVRACEQPKRKLLRERIGFLGLKAVDVAYTKCGTVNAYRREEQA